MQEKDVEKYLVNRIEKMGGLCFKFTSPGTLGVPDRIIIYQGEVYFVEVKRPGQKPRPSQRVIHKKMASQGVTVDVIDSIVGVKCFVQKLLVGGG